MRTTAPAPRVLVVDDEPNIVDVVSMALRYQGFEVASAANGAEALARVATFKPQLMVLDVMLPDMEGFEVAERLGAQRGAVPIIFLTARDATEDKLRGLTTGGDDYVTKPFSLAELLARVRAHLRRTAGPAPGAVLRFAELELDEAARTLRVAGEPVALTRSEFDLLHLLMRSPNRVFSRLALMEHLQEEALGSERTIDVHLRHLRVKIEAEPGRPRWLETVFGVGYRFNPGEEA